MTGIELAELRAIELHNSFAHVFHGSDTVAQSLNHHDRAVRLPQSGMWLRLKNHVLQGSRIRCPRMS
jgi:hypothetical protein